MIPGESKIPFLEIGYTPFPLQGDEILPRIFINVERENSVF